MCKDIFQCRELRRFKLFFFDNGHFSSLDTIFMRSLLFICALKSLKYFPGFSCPYLAVPRVCVDMRKWKVLDGVTIEFYVFLNCFFKLNFNSCPMVL